MGTQNAAKRRLLEVSTKEVSVVGSPAIDEEFVIIKSEEQPTGSPMDKIKAAMAEKGMTVEMLAEATGIDLAKLTAAMEADGQGLEEEDYVKIAGALEMEKLEDDQKPAAAPAPDAAAGRDVHALGEEGASTVSNQRSRAGTGIFRRRIHDLSESAPR